VKSASYCPPAATKQRYDEDNTMTIKIATITLLLFAAASASASANRGMNATSSVLGSIVQGHGKPGDTARSLSDPDVTFRVLDNGKVERTNERLGTVSITNPKTEWTRTSRSR
jgi:hypothetical protein